MEPVIPHPVKANEHEKPNKGHAALKILAEHVAQQLEERGFCLVFEQDLERCWPTDRMSRTEREGKIQDFAKSQGWTAAILDAGFSTRAIFQKAEPDIEVASILFPAKTFGGPMSSTNLSSHLSRNAKLRPNWKRKLSSLNAADADT